MGNIFVSIVYVQRSVDNVLIDEQYEFRSGQSSVDVQSHFHGVPMS